MKDELHLSRSLGPLKGLLNAYSSRSQFKGCLLQEALLDTRVCVRCHFWAVTDPAHSESSLGTGLSAPPAQGRVSQSPLCPQQRPPARG